MTYTSADCLDHKYRIESGFTCIKCGYNRPSEEDFRLEELRKAQETAWDQGHAGCDYIFDNDCHTQHPNPYRSQP